jgi:hypothetical protein
MATHLKDRAEDVAERVEHLFQEIPDAVERYRSVVSLLTDEFGAVDREAVERTLGLIQKD